MENKGRNGDLSHENDNLKDRTNAQSNRAEDTWNNDWSKPDNFNATNRNNEQGQQEDVNMSSAVDFEDNSENSDKRHRTPGL